MKPVVLPKPQDMRPGTKWNLGPGLLMRLHAGKHGAGDLRIEITGNGAPTHQGVFTLLLALMVSEDRYRTNGKGRGAEHFIAHLGTVVHWFRTHVTPKERFVQYVEHVEGEAHETPGGWV